jgi:hypothetical protein
VPAKVLATAVAADVDAAVVGAVVSVAAGAIVGAGALVAVGVGVAALQAEKIIDANIKQDVPSKSNFLLIIPISF